MYTAIKLTSDAQRWLLRASKTFCSLVDRYAIAKAILNDKYQDDYVTNDFFYYCIAKSSKSLVAINALLERGLGEDAQILLRSAYENYLAIAFLLGNPNRLDDLVDRKVGVRAGRYQHPVSSKGKKDRRKIVDEKTGEIFEFDVSIAEMASKSHHVEDEPVHWPLYGYLSEHCHPNFVASGNYRHANQVKYSYQNRFHVTQAGIFSVYVYLLLLAEIRSFENLRPLDVSRTSDLFSAGSQLIHRALEVMTFTRSMEALPKAFRTRIAKHEVSPRS